MKLIAYLCEKHHFKINLINFIVQTKNKLILLSLRLVVLVFLFHHYEQWI